MVYRAAAVDGAPAEHVRLAFEFPLPVQHLQGTEQRVGGIVPEHLAVPRAVQQAVFCPESVIEEIQLRLFPFHIPVPRTVELQVDEPPCAVPDGDHAPGTGGGQARQPHRLHPGILPEIKLPPFLREAKVAHAQVRRNLPLGLPFLPRRIHQQKPPVRRRYVFYGLPKQVL